MELQPDEVGARECGVEEEDGDDYDLRIACAQGVGGRDQREVGERSGSEAAEQLHWRGAWE